jgi:ubiquinol-cytochrome c reductase cytochrome c subunit
MPHLSYTKGSQPRIEAAGSIGIRVAWTSRRRSSVGAPTKGRAAFLAVPVAAILGFVVLGGWRTSAHAQSTPSDPNAFTRSQVDEGHQLFLVHCSSCHGPDGAGTASAPSIITAGAAAADFQLRTGRMPLSNPKELPVRHAPAFPDAQIRALVAYVASLDNGPPIPTVLPGHLPDGNQLYSLNCAQCHNAAGAGGALGYGDIVPPLHHATALDVVEAARTGPGPMPVFGPDTLSDQQVSDIAAYVQYLHRPDDRGGFGLGHLGPIPEGFVGWVVGLGLLLLAARLIGTRA